jgi:hypothetical protein
MSQFMGYREDAISLGYQLGFSFYDITQVSGVYRHPEIVIGVS